MDKNFKVIDLTHNIDSSIPGWDGDCGFKMDISLDYKECTPPDIFLKYDISTPCGVGTHIDSPSHVIPGGRTIEKIMLNELITECVVIDVSHELEENYIVTPDIILKFEKENGQIKLNSFVVFYTGWDKYWDTPEKYINNHIFPSVHEDTAKLLISRGISGLGIDTLSADTGLDGFPVHRIILGANKYLVENITNLKELPPVGSKIVILPLKINNGSEAPARVVALF